MEHQNRSLYSQHQGGNRSAETEQSPRKQDCEEPERVIDLTVNERESHFIYLFHDLRKVGSKFFDHFRMSISTFDKILNQIGTDIEKGKSTQRDAYSPTARLAVTLRYLATGSTFTKLHQEYGMRKATIASIIKQVCDSILHHFLKTSFPPVTAAKFESVAVEFKNKTEFPHCIGSIGIKYIPLKGATLSLVAVADSDYRFLFIDMDLQKKKFNSFLFEKTKLWNSIISNSLPLPAPKPLSVSTNKCVPYVFLGNEEFGIQDNLMCPFSENNLTEQNKIFNNRLSNARKYVDGAFAILSNKWGILHKHMGVKTDLAMNIVNTCCVLHNLVVESEGVIFDDTLAMIGLMDVKCGNRDHGRNGADTRQTFADYFVSVECTIP